MAAAAHGASFPMARKVEASMSVGQMIDYARGSMTAKPEHVKAAKSHPHANLGTYLHPKKGR